jgi:hypothetical protein
VKRLLPYLLLLAEVLLFYRHALFLPDQYVFPWDLRGFHLPHAYFYADSLARGELPLWDPYTYCGRPFQANIQTQVFYPTMPFVVPFELYGLELNVALHVFLAGVFTYLLALSLGLNRPSAFLAASTYQLCGFFAAHVEHMGAITIAAWLPAAWFCVIRRRWILLAGVFAMSILGGLTPLTVLVFTTTFLLALLFAFTSNREPRWRLPAAVLAAAGFSVLLTAVQLLPTFQLASLSIAQYRADWLKSGGGIPLQALVSLVLPNYYDIFDLSKYKEPFELTFMYLYCGLLSLTLAIAALIFGWRDVKVRIFGLLGLLAGWAMLGDSTAVWRAFYSLLPMPIRIGLHPEYSIPAFTLCVAILAGMGLQRALFPDRYKWLLAAIAALDLIVVSSGRPMNAYKLADDRGVSRTSYHGLPSVLTTLHRLTDQTVPPSRIDTIDDSMEWAMAAPTMQLYTANGNDPMALARVIQARLQFARGERWGAYYQVTNLTSPMLAEMNIRYLLSRTPVDTIGTPFHQVATIPGSTVYENLAVKPRFYLDPPSGSVRVIRYLPRTVELGVSTAEQTRLVTSETNYPGWRAWIDGREQPLETANTAFRSLVVPPGNHRIEMRFVPALFWWSALVSGTAWLCWLGALWLLR